MNDDLWPQVATWKGVPVNQLDGDRRAEMISWNNGVAIADYRPMVTLGSAGSEYILLPGRLKKFQDAMTNRWDDHMLDSIRGAAAADGTVTNVVINPRQQSKTFTMEALEEAVAQIKEIPLKIAREREQEALAEIPGFGAF